MLKTFALDLHRRYYQGIAEEMSGVANALTGAETTKTHKECNLT